MLARCTLSVRISVTSLSKPVGGLGFTLELLTCRLFTCPANFGLAAELQQVGLIALEAFRHFQVPTRITEPVSLELFNGCWSGHGVLLSPESRPQRIG